MRSRWARGPTLRGRCGTLHLHRPLNWRGMLDLRRPLDLHRTLDLRRPMHLGGPLHLDRPLHMLSGRLGANGPLDLLRGPLALCRPLR